MAISFKIYQVKSKAAQPSYVYMGKPYIDDNDSNKSFYPHISNSGKCDDIYLFTTLVGSKNIRFNPSSLVPKMIEGNREVLKDPFIHVDTRWYHFRYPGIETDVPENIPPNNFVKYHGGSRGDYTVEWRKLTSSDGSVLIKPSLESKVFWNGKTYISDSDAGFNETVPKNIYDDLIYLKTRHYIEILRNTVKTDSLSIIYKKYIDECKWKSTYLMKRFRRSYCVYVDEYRDHMNIGIDRAPGPTAKGTPGYLECECGCIPCWEMVSSDALLKYSVIFDGRDMKYSDSGKEKLVQKWENYKVYKSNPEVNNYVEMTWIEQFEYNWLNNLGYNRYKHFPLVVDDNKKVEIKFNKFSDRQNRFYGINPRTATREHHAMPPVKPSNENPHIYSYTNTHSLFHPDVFVESLSASFDRYATTPTKLITKGRIDDGKERVVVPPGVIFRTYKAVPGILSLYELDVAYRRPDEYHFAVDGYGNILGYKNLPYPGLIHVEYPIEVGGLRTAAVNDEDMREKINISWESYRNNNKNGFYDEDALDYIHKHRVENNYFLATKTHNAYDRDAITSCEVMSISGNENWSYTNESMDRNRKGHATVTLPDGKIMILGGFDIPNEVLNSCQIYDPTTETWSSCSSMKYRRYNHAAIVIQDISGSRVMVIGGADENTELSSCEVYDYTTDSWSIMDGLNTRRQEHTATLLPSGKILVVGGYNTASVNRCKRYEYINYISQCEIYDTISMIGEWSVVGNLSFPRSHHTATLFDTNKVLIYGGFGDGYATTYSVYIDDINENIKLRNYSIQVPPRRNHTAHLLPDGKVMVIGGYDSTGEINTCDYFITVSPYTYSVYTAPPLNEARFDHTSTTDDVNFIHVVGGKTFNNVLQSSEVFDISASNWVVSSNLQSPRFSHTAQYIQESGDTIVFGGYSGMPINEIENISGGGTHTYVNIHHCPIWIDKDIFCSYLAAENPDRFNSSDRESCNKTICLDLEPTQILPPEPSSSSSSESPLPSSSSSISDEEKKSIIITDEVDLETPIDQVISSSSSEIITVTEPREILEYTDNLELVNTVHGFIDTKVYGTYNFIVPMGVNRIRVLLWSAGAGGGGYAHIDVTNEDREHIITKSSGGGGGSGSHMRIIKDVIPSTNIQYVVGKGGKTGDSILIRGMSINGETSWYDSNDILIKEPSTVSGYNGENGGDTIFENNYRVYGGRSGIGGIVQRGNGVAGKSGIGSPGGISNSYSGVEIYKGVDGESGEWINEGPKGPSLYGGTPGFNNTALGGICSIPGAGSGGNGSNNIDVVTDGQDGRVRIEW